MKTLVLTLLGIFSLLSITEENNPLVEPYNLEGVWELQHQFLYDHNEVSDTVLNQNGYRQIKMYSKGKVMWTRFDPADNNEWFGYGTYEVKDGMLQERLEYASGPMMKIVDTTKVFVFELVMGEKSYQQIELNKDGTYSRSENYNKVE
ncbi:hypothetical protein [Aquimarina sp. MMG016]|uniref:hypothetical protein n=1 Tax=Aquimarina sp. MMG016 TaxID=2822690 RepID=UPI001B3A56D3|nr:hypothetical protein [Aquimarina sp. MMG016]MBQ4820355.1 hypothetical protein [Aquimarina sp. MMG016]